MTFTGDLATDRDDVFLNTNEFAEIVSYRVAATDTTTANVPATIEDEGDTVLSDGIQARISAADVAAPAKGDQIIRGGATYTVIFIQEETPMFILDMEREEEIT